MKKLIVLVLALTLVVAGFSGCTKEEAPEATEAPAAEATEASAEEATEAPAEEATVSGEVSVSGSTSVEKIGLALGDEFMAMYPDVTFTYQGIGSSAGVKNANEGVTMIGTASRNIKDSEKEFGMTEQVLAYDGIAVVVNPAVDVDALTMDQVQGIFLGEITDWSEVGGTAGAIAVISREDGSGTRGAFEEIVGFEDALTTDATIAEGNGGVKAAVVENPSAIGYVSFTYLDDTIKDVTVDGGVATVEAVLDGSYPVSRPFNMVWHDANLTEAAIAFIEFTKSDVAKEIIAEKGGIPLSDETAAASSEEVSGEVTVSGSTSVEKIGLALGDEFMAMYPDVTFTYQGIGSSAGVKNANEKVTMIGTASRNIKDSEKEFGMTEQVLAFDGIAVVVNPAVDVDALTMDQVQGIFKGEITDWSEVGGTAGAIAVISREDGSGTRGAFEEIVDFEDVLTADATIAEGNGGVKAAVAENPSAIGYVSFTYLDDTIKDVTVDGGEATVEAVLDGSYPVSRPFNMVWHEDALSDAAKAFIEFTKSDIAKEIIAEKGGIPIS